MYLILISGTDAVLHRPTGTVIHVIPKKVKSQVGGVATLGRKLFIVNHLTFPCVDVYSTTDFTKNRGMAVHGLSKPRSLAACEVNKFLYISECELNQIHCVDLSSSLVKIWSIEGLPWGLSVTKIIICW